MIDMYHTDHMNCKRNDEANQYQMFTKTFKEKIIYLSTNSKYKGFMFIINNILAVEWFMVVDCFVKKMKGSLILTNKL